jgi:hypothetical protein
MVYLKRPYAVAPGICQTIVRDRVPDHQQTIRVCLWRQLPRRGEERETNNKYVNFQAESAPPDTADAAHPIGAFIFTPRLASQAMTPDTKDSTS